MQYHVQDAVLWRLVEEVRQHGHRLGHGGTGLRCGTQAGPYQGGEVLGQAGEEPILPMSGLHCGGDGASSGSMKWWFAREQDMERGAEREGLEGPVLADSQVGLRGRKAMGAAGETAGLGSATGMFLG